MKKQLLATLLLSSSTLFAVDGALLYKNNCAFCHGQNGNVPVMGQGAILSEMSPKQIVHKFGNMKKTHTYYGPMRKIVRGYRLDDNGDYKPQVSKYQLKAIAKYVGQKNVRQVTLPAKQDVRLEKLNNLSNDQIDALISTLESMKK